MEYIRTDADGQMTQHVSFKAGGHRITEELHQYVCDLLASGSYNNKEVAELAGLGKNVIKSIDCRSLKELYTTPDGSLLKPAKHARFIGIDEFKLHNGHRYATHIIDMETGHILWISGGKKKQTVYDFIEHVGMEWMDHVEAFACDMNSDFQEAFEEMCHATGNRHLLWFEKLLGNHFEGIIAHATYDISAAKIEGINNKIKTLRRQGYGYPDDEYFFLKLFDMSRKPYIRNLLRKNESFAISALSRQVAR